MLLLVLLVLLSFCYVLLLLSLLLYLLSTYVLILINIFKPCIINLLYTHTDWAGDGQGQGHGLVHVGRARFQLDTANLQCCI